ncbi:PQQ-dependent sugar dehydrogenase [Leptolyngbya sp. NIES-2104]|uniref:PQQ-dependent sugar dehydrogenase n=1 Tax=Leptolyngbya sp. NIES-2104 TaxID=1552121 RepID=UPI0006ECA92F|nr:PQQ-dependent sugar dehydrogenase [Leptolyngbya sp. NIES-2104]GAP93713.1 PQQ-dependent oxidoreductase, gdhB family [Leptolyngbya sp. NIES-2104]
MTIKRIEIGIAIASIGLSMSACSLLPRENATSAASPEASSTQVASTSGSAQGYRTKEVLNGLERPWGMAWLPDGRLLVSEKSGTLRVVNNGKLEPTAISGVPPVMYEGQGGFMDVSIHPRFAENRLIYLTYSHGTPEANRTRVARAVLDGNTLRDLKPIFEVKQTKSGTQHFGSRIAWLPDNTMLVSIGDGGNPPVSLEGELIRRQAQNLRSRLGKVVRLNDDGSVPRDNPFVNKPDADPTVWSYGHRNIQGLAIDPTSKRVWASEHGSQGGDELNLVEAGQNYGWPVVTHSKEYWGGEITRERSRPEMVDPKAVWTPATAPGGLLFYTGDRFPAWKGNLFSSGLVSRDLKRIELDAQGNVRTQEAIKIGQRVRDVSQAPDGLIYFITDDGVLWRLEPKS